MPNLGSRAKKSRNATRFEFRLGLLLSSQFNRITVPPERKESALFYSATAHLSGKTLALPVVEVWGTPPCTEKPSHQNREHRWLAELRDTRLNRGLRTMDGIVSAASKTEI